jgi:hypothetical protein
MSKILINGSVLNVNTSKIGLSSGKALPPEIRITSYSDTSVNFTLFNPYGAVSVTYYYTIKRGATTIVSTNTTSSNSSVNLSRTGLLDSSEHTIECYIARTGYTNSETAIVKFATSEFEGTQTPTINSILCRDTSGNFTLRVNVKNNHEDSATVQCSGSSNFSGSQSETIASGGNFTFVFSVFSDPTGRNETYYARATAPGKIVSFTTSLTQFISICQVM